MPQRPAWIRCSQHREGGCPSQTEPGAQSPKPQISRTKAQAPVGRSLTQLLHRQRLLHGGWQHLAIAGDCAGLWAWARRSPSCPRHWQVCLLLCLLHLWLLMCGLPVQLGLLLSSLPVLRGGSRRGCLCRLGLCICGPVPATVSSEHSPLMAPLWSLGVASRHKLRHHSHMAGRWLR